MRVRHTTAARVTACCAAALALTGCGAGQITQTDHQVAAVDGTSANVGNTIALRNVLIPYPHNATGSYPAGSTVPVLLAIINQGSVPDELIGVTSPVAERVVVQGSTQIPAGTTVISNAGTAPVGDHTTSPLVVGELHILLTPSEPLPPGLSTPVSFQFRNAGTLTLRVPMGASATSAG